VFENIPADALATLASVLGGLAFMGLLLLFGWLDERGHRHG
jgi:hypothetical protein